MAHGKCYGAVLVTLPLAWACSDDPGPARAEARAPLGDETVVSALLGFSLEEVLPAGEQSAVLTWREVTADVRFSPTAATSMLRWSLALPSRESDGFSIEEVDVECDRERFITNSDSLCADQLEAALLLRLDSADGALSEVVPVTFIAQSPSSIAWSNSDLDTTALAGTFSIAAAQGDPASLRLGVFSSMTDGRVTGSLISDVVLERERAGGGELIQGTVVNVAEWR